MLNVEVLRAGGAQLRGKPVRLSISVEVGKAGAAPATVSGELVSTNATEANASGRPDTSDNP